MNECYCTFWVPFFEKSHKQIVVQKKGKQYYNATLCSFIAFIEYKEPMVKGHNRKGSYYSQQQQLLRLLCAAQRTRMYYGDIVRTLKKKKKDNEDTIHLIKSSLHFLPSTQSLFWKNNRAVYWGAIQGPGFDQGLTGAVLEVLFLDQTI